MTKSEARRCEHCAEFHPLGSICFDDAVTAPPRPDDVCECGHVRPWHSLADCGLPCNCPVSPSVRCGCTNFREQPPPNPTLVAAFEAFIAKPELLETWVLQCWPVDIEYTPFEPAEVHAALKAALEEKK